MMCEKCGKLMAVLTLLVGIGFLLADLGTWTFWGITGWTAVFLLVGLSMLGKSCCGMCKGACSMKGKKKK